MLEPRPIYKIGEIIEVKNRTEKRSHDYSWIIRITDRDGNTAMWVALDACGLFTGGVALGKQALEYYQKPGNYEKMKRYWNFFTDEDIKNILSESLDHDIQNHEIKKMERLAFYSSIGNFLFPLWEITMADGTVYYYSIKRDMVYSIDSKIPWKKNKNGYRTHRSLLVPHRDYLPDTVNDELVILKAHPR